MNQVDIYINNERLDLFKDESISINLSVQNYKELDKVLTDFTQSFTIPASQTNNRILSHYYNTSVSGSFDARLRQPAYIEINSLLFRNGVVELEQVEIKNNMPYAYTLTFFGELVNLTDLFGEDYLYDLDLSAYNHDYDGATIIQGFAQDALLGGDVFYPLMSSVRNWVYNISSSNPAHNDDIAYVGSSGHDHGVEYDEIKPALKVVKIFEAIEAKYGIDFTGDFMSDTQFNKLFLWMHRFEGKLYDSTTAIAWNLINFNRNTGGGVEFNLTTDTWIVGTTEYYDLSVTLLNVSANYELGIFQNGVQVASYLADAHPASSSTITFEGYGFDAGDEVKLYIRPQTPVSISYQCTNYEAERAGPVVPFQVDQTASATNTFQLKMSPLAPEIKVADFVAGIVKMHNLVITPVNATTFNLQTLDDWYADGTDRDFQTYFDIQDVQVLRPELYRRIEYKYQETDQILGYQYAKTNGIGYGDLRANFAFDGDEFKVELPFECPLFELLSDYNNTDVPSGLSDVLVYKSQTREPDTDYANRFQPYVGKPILIYGEFGYNFSGDGIAFIDESATKTQVLEAWYANTSSTYTGTGLAHTLTFGSDIDPYYLKSLSNSLYNDYWEDYISDLYNSRRRTLNAKAVLPLGKILTLSMNDKILWSNEKWLINNISMNLSTGECQFELLNYV